MKILIAYYSRSFKTEKLAEVLQKKFLADGHLVDIEKIKPLPERSFWSWFFYRLFHGECAIKPPKILDLSSYDLICLGSPNWTRLSLPMARYLSLVQGLPYKRVGFFATTLAIPSIEWYIFSAYFLDLTFAQRIEQKKGRLLDSLLLSSGFKNWSVDSDYGQKAIARFYQKLTDPAPSLKNYILQQKETEEVRFLIMILMMVLVASLLWQFSSLIFRTVIFSWPQYSWLFGLGVLTLFALLALKEERKHLALAKYLTGGVLSLVWTFLVVFSHQTLGRSIILGYVLILSFMSLFREPKAVWITGLSVVAGYLYLFLTGLFSPILDFPLDVGIILLSTTIITIITHNLQSHDLKLLDAQDELESAREDLEKKVIELQKAWEIAENEKGKTQKVITHLADGLLVFDGEDRLILINPVAQTLLNTSAEPILGKKLKELKSLPDFSLLVEMILQKIAKKEIQNQQNKVLEVTLVSVEEKDKKLGMRLLLLHDVTEERQLEEMKVDFASIAVHELRTPLTSLHGYLSILSEQEKPDLGAEGRLYLERALQSCRRLSSLVDSLLAVIRIERGQAILTLEPLSISPLIQEVVSDLELYLQEKKQSLKVTLLRESLPNLRADKLKTKQILSNLITNAIRYTQKEGRIEVSVKPRDGFAEISVSDNGPGIAEGIKPYLFKKFLRGEDPLRKETEGVGLGLYLVKSLVEMQGGKIWFESEVGKGSIFHITLPCA